MLDVRIATRRGDFALDVAFTAPMPGVTALFGRSGAGKTTVVAAIAGLLRPEAGRIAVGDTVFFDRERGIDLPAERRRVGYVFQDARLFPHLTVAANLRYGLRRAPSAERRIDFGAVVELLGIGHLLARRPHTLSGGERQRVAVGRALLAQPKVLLMDEPLASLDAERKTEVLPYLARLQAELALPTVYVSHALDEVDWLATTLVLLEAGRVAAAGPLAELHGRLDIPALAGRADAAAVVETVVGGHDPAGGLTRLDLPGAHLLAPLFRAPLGRPVRVRVRARDVILATAVPAGLSLHNILPATVSALRADAGGVLVRLAVGQGAVLIARVTPSAVARLDLAPGRPIYALIKAMSVERAAPA